MTTTQEQDVGYKFTPEAVGALSGAGFSDLPPGVVIRHREASNREKERFQAQIDALMKPGALDDSGAQELLTDLLMRRVEPGTPREYLRELVRDMGETDMSCHLVAFVQGVMPDPKAVGRAIQTIRSGLTARLLSVMQSGERPCSAISIPDSSSVSTTSPTSG